jgi:hypothetical protein
MRACLFSLFAVPLLGAAVIDSRLSGAPVGAGSAPGAKLALGGQASTITVPITLSLQAFQDKLLGDFLREKGAKSLPVSLASGSKQLKVPTHIQSVITVVEPVRVVKKVVKRVPKPLRIIGGGLLFGRPELGFVEEICEVVEFVNRPVEKVIQQLTDLEVEFGYNLTLDHIDLRMQGNQIQLQAVVGLSITSKILKAGVVPIGAKDIDRSQGSCQITRSVRWSDDGKRLLLGPGETRVDLDPSLKLTAFGAGVLGPQLIVPLQKMAEEKLSQLLRQVIPGEIPIPDADKLLGETTNPILLGDDIWLSLRPEALLLGPAHGKGKTLTTSLSLQAKPLVVAGKRPEAGKAPVVRTTSAVQAGGVRLAVEGRITHEWLSRKLSEELRDVAAQFSRTLGEGQPPIEIEPVRLHPVGRGRIELEAPITKPAAASLVVSAELRYDKAKQTLRLVDLKGEIKQRDLAAWAVALTQNKRLQELLDRNSDKAVFHLGEVLEKVRQFEVPWQQGRLKGRLDTFDLAEFTVTTEGDVRVNVTASGAVEVGVLKP